MGAMSITDIVEELNGLIEESEGITTIEVLEIMKIRRLEMIIVELKKIASKREGK